MATTTELQKIATLTDQLAPVGNKQQGMPIDADDWNTLVKVLTGLLEVSRAQEEDLQGSLDQRFAPLVHDHLGQVSLAWLDADLQKRVSDAGAGVSTRLVVADMSQKISSLGTQIAQFTVQVQDMRRQLDGFSVDSADRGKALRDVDTRLAAIDNLRTTVTGLSTQFDGLKTNVNSVLDLRKTLSDAAGNPINVGQIQTDVAALKTLGDNLKGIDGNPVRMRDIQLQLNEVADVAGVGGPGGLQTRFDKLSADMETRLDGRIDQKTTAVHDQLQGESNAAITQVRNDFTAAIGKARTDLDQSASDRVKAAVDGINASTGGRINDALQAFGTETAASVNAQLDQRLAGLPNQISTASTKAANDAVTALSATLTSTINTQMQAQSTAASAAIDTRFTAFQQTFDAFRTDTQALVKSSVGSASDALTISLNARVDAQVGQARLAIEGELDGRVKTAVDASNATFDSRVGAVLDQRLGTLDTRISQAVSQATKDLPGEVTAEVKSQITALNITGQIQDSSTRTVQQLRSEMAQSIADQQAKTTTSITDAIKLLRGEIGVASKNAADSALSGAGTLVSGLRGEFNTTINNRLQNVVIRNSSTGLTGIVNP